MRAHVFIVCSLLIGAFAPMASGVALAEAQSRSQTYVWVEFEGRALTKAELKHDDAFANKSEALTRVKKDKVQIPPMHLPSDLGDRGAFIAVVMEGVKQHFEGLNIKIVAENPRRDDHHLVVVGGTKSLLAEDIDLGYDWGPTDCGNENPRNVGYVFSETLHAEDGTLSKAKLSATIAQVIGHIVGLQHVKGDPTNIMTAVSNSTDTFQFSTKCTPLLSPLEDPCPVRTCMVGEQNSRADLEAILGLKPDGTSTTSDGTDSSATDTDNTMSSSTDTQRDDTTGDPAEETGETDGCSARVSGPPAGGSWVAGLILFGLALRRRRPRSR